ncbi:hypothetical protein ACJMK2_027612 [Sinanodonta woodiana]|uniref:5'-nucleotidase n=1 Tax=Sinanodonta woodiana TaxID=1069815 RepID=A0ABD3X4H7_SINWO
MKKMGSHLTNEMLVILVGLLAGYGCGLELTILHTNDVHAHYDEMGKYYGDCTIAETAARACTGGVARHVTMVNRIRAERDNVILLDAGDRFTGTVWFTQYQGLESSYFMNKLKYDAMCLGNHEFDRGVEGLVPFLDNVTFPVLSANMDVSGEPRLQGKIKKSTVKILPSGVKVGIIGVSSKETAYISNAGPTVKFQDEIMAIRDEADRLTSQGVQILIALSHAGYDTEQDIAKAVPSLDIVVGGHSHTFLYSGPQPSSEPVEGPYPTVVVQDGGRKVPIVTAFAWGKYLGRLDVAFDADGTVLNWTGNPILLNSSVEQDNATLLEVQQMAQSLKELRNTIIGKTAVNLEGDYPACRIKECSMGNLFVDAIIDFHLDKKNDDEIWGAAPIAIWNGGGIRASIRRGKVSLGDVYNVLPYANSVDKITISGFDLRQSLEQAVANYNMTNPPAAFPQVSGLRVVYDFQKPKGSRLVSVYARCHKCEDLEYSPLNDNSNYSVLTSAYLVKGGDGYTSFLKNTEHVRLNSLDSDVLMSYIAKLKIVYAETDGRISFKTMDDGKCNNINGVNSKTGNSFALILAVMICILRIC